MVERGERIGYTPYAILYDEQPTVFKQSWDQRTRWIKGYFQAYYRYGWKMLKSVFTDRNFPCFDMLVNTFAGTVLTLGTLLFYVISIVKHAVIGIAVWEPLLYLGEFIGTCYLTVFIIGCITVKTEWDFIYCPKLKILRYTITFPLFIFTLLPIVICVPFDKNIWPQVTHTKTVRIEDIKAASEEPPDGV
jgi:cellulose synthase/poly-beta-1,6-N-acetylglucosamine synthase-like glycosyltransferase